MPARATAAFVLLFLLIPVEGRCAEPPSPPAGRPASGAESGPDSPRNDESADPWALLPDVVVTPNRKESRLLSLPCSVQFFESEEIRSRKMFRTIPDIFSEDPSIMVQKTSYGQGSPFLRGLTGFRTLFLVDGIRLNNSTFREGPNQYWSTVDPFLADRIEVVKGLASVLYGSDAIGGAVNVISRRSRESGEGAVLGGAAHVRETTPDLSSVVRLDVDGGFGREIGVHAGVTYKDFNDFTAGRHVGLVEKSGYGEWDCDIRSDFYPARNLRITAAFQRTDQKDVWRTHGTTSCTPWHGTTAGTDRERSMDQWRDLGYVQIEARDVGDLLEALRFSASCHHQREREFRIKSNGASEVQVCDVVAPGFWGSADFDTPAGDITAGAEYYRDFVLSGKDSYNADGSFKSSEIQGPVADHSLYDIFGAFVQDEYAPFEELRFTAGLRYTLARLVGGRVKDPDTGTRTRISDTFENLSFALKTGFSPHECCNVYCGVSTAFRAPNLSDLTRLDMARSDEIETPSPGLEPELFTSFDLGIKIKRERMLAAELAVYYTVVEDMIVRYPTGAIIDGKKEVRKANVGDGWICGIEASATWSPFARIELKAGAAATQGKVDTYVTSEKIRSREWMSRMPPTSGVMAAKYSDESGKWWIEASWKWAWRQRKLSPSDRTDTQRIPPDGTPGYGVVNLRGGIALSGNLSLALAVLNLGNKEYRIHGSGQNEPGLQAQASIDLKF